MNLARSWPCFEYWFLLHFRYTDSPFGGAGHLSPCDECTKALRAQNCWPAFEKDLPRTFTFLMDRLKTAMALADQAAQSAATRDGPNPST